MLSQLLVISSFYFLCIDTVPAPFTPCSELKKNVSSSDVQVDVSECTGFDGRCPLWLGGSHNFTLRFLPVAEIPTQVGLERQILAKFPEKDGEPNVEIPYGPSVLVNKDTFRVSTGEPISKDGNQVKPGEWYLHNSIFPVIAQAPKVNLTVRYLIREKISLPASKRRRVDWRNHPGLVFACVEIPVEIMDKPSKN